MQQSLFSPFVAKPADFERWSKQCKALFELLKDMRLHRREELLEVTRALNITAVVSDLRHQGAVIECTRNGEQIYYQLTAMTPNSTVRKGIHCVTCRCSE
jgi:hypothetical protein